MILEKLLLLITVLAVLLCLFGCDANPIDPNRPVPASVGRFTDGNVTCYTYFQNSISCVKDARPLPEEK